jgi:hypothetical protein
MVVAGLLLAGCSAQTPDAASSSSTSPSRTSSSPSPTPAPASTTASPTPAIALVSLNCYDSDYDDLPTIEVAAGKPDFSQAWSQGGISCDSTRSNLPITALEVKVLKISKYDSVYPLTLFEICGAVDPDDVYADPTFIPEGEQLDEIKATLALCPTHPQAKAWSKALQRGKARSQLVLIDGDGSYEVGVDIKPGSYVTEDRVTDCYWERVDGSGRTIDNDFVTGAPRVRVTIRASDAGFVTEGCGVWVRE